MFPQSFYFCLEPADGPLVVVPFEHLGNVLLTGDALQVDRRYTSTVAAFVVNDIVLADAFGIPTHRMNRFGCSLVWGHPQAPTGLRAIIELIEELAMRGGGQGLFTGCAAGDSGMAVVIRVGDDA